MATATSSITRAPRPSSLADVLDLILDKGLVIDAYVRVSAVGIELLTIDARIVIASVDTYLHYAEAVNRLDLTQTETQGITGILGDGSGSSDGQSGSSGEGSAKRPPRGQSSKRSLTGGEDRSSGTEPDADDADGGEEKGDESRARSLARRIGEKGKWNS